MQTRFWWLVPVLTVAVFIPGLASAAEDSGEVKVSDLDAWLAKPPSERGPAPTTALSRAQAEQTVKTLAAEQLAALKAARAAEIEARSITLEGKTLRWLEKEFGKAEPGQRSLWISMHGGGGAPAAVNDQQWRNQIRLYQPAEGIYLAPRAPSDTWDLWHQGHIDPLFVRLIEGMVATRGVNPDRVYLMGYSAGGDGVWQLAPRMADRFAAAAMMAGHPNESSVVGLRNLPIALFVGGNDAAFNRNKIVAAKGAELDALHKADPKGYTHLVRVYEGLPHWMNLKDAEAVPWMAQFQRVAWPEKIVWRQDNVVHEQFYWLKIPAGSGKADQQITATASGHEIIIEGDVPAGLTLQLSDVLVDLDAPLTVKINGKVVHEGTVPRTAAAIANALNQRADAKLCPSAVLTLK